MKIFHYENIHKGKTILLVGNGPNLELTPPEWFSYPTIGMNTACEWEGEWIPDYYVAVDKRVYREFGEKINRKFRDIPKFIPHPKMTVIWKGENFVGFKHPPGLLWPSNRLELWEPNLIRPVVYGNVMHIAMKLAYYMGAKKILIIGMEHKPHFGDRHFWGIDTGMNSNPPIKEWFKGYQILVRKMEENRVKMLNISEGTKVPERIIPRDNFKKYISNSAKKELNND